DDHAAADGHGEDGRHHERPPLRRPPAPRPTLLLRQPHLPLVDGVQHCRGPGRVVVLERAVVGLVDVARLVLAVEVLERLQQEPALLFEVGESIDVDGRHAPSRSSSRWTNSRSSADTSTPGWARHRRKATASPARATTTATTGSTHTSDATP